MGILTTVAGGVKRAAKVIVVVIWTCLTCSLGAKAHTLPDSSLSIFLAGFLTALIS
jgi:hypothetical protein